MSVSLKDVAQEAGVSVCTVSRVINNTYRHKVSDATRKKVYAAMRKLNYEPNLNARALVKKRTFLIGLLVSRLVVSFVSDIVQGIQDEADKHNCSILFYSTYNDVVKEKACFEALQRKRVDGIIYMPGAADFCTSNEGKRYLQTVISEGARIVQMCSNYPQIDTPYVVVDNEAGGYVATRHLASLGHTRIAHFHESATRDGQERYHGYVLALEGAGIPCDTELVRPCRYDWRSGYEAMQQLLALSNPPTAVVACDDMSAWGAMQATLDYGLKVPDDVAIVGYDDVTVAELLPAALTTIHHPKEDLGALTFKMLLRHIDGKPPLNYVLKPELIVRQSCGAKLLPRFESFIQK
ncbi:MAG: LacI family transcriptional regulator [Limnochordia bacterium]|nr:LacI family transcriptional regulator [Limnochordia bacterium]